jgi:hypothetical protein
MVIVEIVFEGYTGRIAWVIVLGSRQRSGSIEDADGDIASVCNAKNK